MWAVKLSRKESGKRKKEGGRNGFDEHQEIKQNKGGTGSGGKPKFTTNMVDRHQVT